LAAVFFMIVVPTVTCPSEAMATRPFWRTQTTVVERHSSPGRIENEDTAFRILIREAVAVHSDVKWNRWRI
jgi:hypothetical protein